jgi:CDGSH-type Zn-finger protein
MLRTGSERALAYNHQSNLDSIQARRTAAMAVKITIKDNGPYRVECADGEVELLDASGNKHDLAGKTAFSLCRCGASVKKPFCDGTHSKLGFQAAERAVQQAEGQVPPYKPRTEM